VVFFGLFH